MSSRATVSIYYGWLVTGASGDPNHLAQAIAAARPGALVSAFYTDYLRYTNLSPQALDLLHGAGITVYAYVPTGYGLRDNSLVRAEVVDYLRNGVDGIFFDEVYTFRDSDRLAYYGGLYELVKEHGGTVVMNTGVASTGELAMSVTDVLMVEHEWRTFYRDNMWKERYAPERFMGVSSNEPHAVERLGYSVTLDTAIRDTREAWQLGIGWHCSADLYTELPAWFAEYYRALGGRWTIDGNSHRPHLVQEQGTC